MRGDPAPGREPEEEEFTIRAFGVITGSRSGPDGSLTVVTEGGRELRITGIRYPRGVQAGAGAEIVVAEEGT